ncbi:unnamed protein product [Phytophthora lilii]|uniref:Unnamed protein product n=1 Tax=Phytophthora lilii TaxID=2077276 RepID=A0A9W6YJJ6_9STRA|nr:unnamed protein product [Phytophthora lilii]
MNPNTLGKFDEIMIRCDRLDEFHKIFLRNDSKIKVSSGKRGPFVIDLNRGSYQNGVITIDATSQLNRSEGFASLRDAYIMLPYKVSMKNTHATNAMAAANRFCVGLKCGNWNVIDSMSLELNGKTIISMADYKLFWNNIRAQISYSPQHVEKHGAESFLFPDAAQSTKYSATAITTGDGYSSNTAISTTFNAGTISATASVANDGFAKRLLFNPPNAGADSSASWPSTGAASATTTIANQLGRGAFVAGAGTAGAIMGRWNYMLKMKLVDRHPIFKELDLMANPQSRLRFRVNQGTAAIDIDSSSRMSLTRTTLSSGNTCPVMVALSTTPNPMYGIISGTGSIAVSWGAVVNSLEPTINGTYMPFTTSRLYVPFVHLENPQAIISKPVKKVRYNDCYAQLFYQRAGIGKQSTQLNAAFDLQLSHLLRTLSMSFFFHSLSRLVVLLLQLYSNFRVLSTRRHGRSTPVVRFETSTCASARNNALILVMTMTSTRSLMRSKIASINGDLTPEFVVLRLSWERTCRLPPKFQTVTSCRDMG